MKATEWTFLALGALSASGATVLTTKWMEAPDRSASAARSPGRTGPTSQLAKIEQTLAALKDHQVKLERSLEDLARRAPAPRDSRRAEGELERSVAAWMEKNLETVAGTPSLGAPNDARASRRAAELAVQQLQRGEWPEGGRAEFWQKLRDEGRLDEVIAILEESAQASPYDADLQLDLAAAYGQKAFDLGPGPLQGHFRTKQDQAFDAALDVAPEHWEARFGKAMALSEWPSFLGKTSESIHQFEILAKQQESIPRSQEHMQTYFFLGNLYRESGRSAEAVATWRRGLEQFPGTEMLEAQLRLFAGEERKP